MRGQKELGGLEKGIMNSVEVKRYEYLDYAKCFGILLIMFGHVTQYFSPMQGISGYVNSFHVPIFFVVSGCLAWHKRDKVIDLLPYIKKRAASLLIPYVIFSIINSVLKLGVLLIKGGLTESVLIEEAVDFFITGNGTVWFLVTLFAIEIVYALISCGGTRQHYSSSLVRLG